jgi:hypothetical protein
MDKWLYGSLYDSIDKFANSLGYENAAIALQLALVPWDSPEDRDAFISSITGEAPKGGETTNYITGN